MIAQGVGFEEIAGVSRGFSYEELDAVERTDAAPLSLGVSHDGLHEIVAGLIEGANAVVKVGFAWFEHNVAPILERPIGSIPSKRMPAWAACAGCQLKDRCRVNIVLLRNSWHSHFDCYATYQRRSIPWYGGAFFFPLSLFSTPQWVVGRQALATSRCVERLSENRTVPTGCVRFANDHKLLY